jgi:hypothetical protein
MRVAVAVIKPLDAAGAPPSARFAAERQVRLAKVGHGYGAGAEHEGRVFRYRGLLADRLPFAGLPITSVTLPLVSGADLRFCSPRPIPFASAERLAA